MHWLIYSFVGKILVEPVPPKSTPTCLQTPMEIWLLVMLSLQNSWGLPPSGLCTNSVTGDVAPLIAGQSWMPLLLRVKESCFLFSLKTDNYFLEWLDALSKFSEKFSETFRNRASHPLSLDRKHFYRHTLYFSDRRCWKTHNSAPASLWMSSVALLQPVPSSTFPSKDRIPLAHPSPLCFLLTSMNNKVILFSCLDFF